MKIHRVVLAIAAVMLCMGDDCDPQPPADRRDQKMQEDITSQAVSQVPLPNVRNFAVRRTLKAAMEAEDKQVPTYSYHFSQFHNCYIPLGGDAHTFGYPIPGATQMTNPQKLLVYGGHYFSMPQADPDTTFKPSSEDATLIMQLNSSTGQNDVSYSEPQVFTRTTPVPEKWVCKPNQ